jgi:dTDP-4-amino-4,6-dideoxygalactose transaminase
MKIPYTKHFLEDDDLAELVAAVKSGVLAQGELNEAFEKELALYFGVSEAITFNSATSALHGACVALGVTAGDSVWTSAISFVASANCAKLCGAKIDLVDVDPTTGNMCIDSLEKKLANASKLPKVVIAVHLGGNVMDMERLKALSLDYHFKVIEDASHAMGSVQKGVKTGAVACSDICVFSTHPAKIITTGEGGVATTDTLDLASSLRLFRSHGVVKLDSSWIAGTNGGLVDYDQVQIGGNYRLSEMGAALGRTQLSKIEIFLEERRRLARVYKDELASFGFKFLIDDNVHDEASWHLCQIRPEGKVNDPQKEFWSRRAVLKLRASGIGSTVHYIPICNHSFFSSEAGDPNLFEQAQIHYRSTISIPLYVGLSEAEQEFVISHVRSLSDR